MSQLPAGFESLYHDVAKLDIKYRLAAGSDDLLTEEVIDDKIRSELHITLRELHIIRESVEYRKAIKEARKDRNRILHDIVLSHAFHMCMNPGIPATLRVQLALGTLGATKVSEDKDDRSDEAAFVFNLVTPVTTENK